MSEGGGTGGYSGWLGGYAKSVAGSVTSFTQDIIEETRNDNRDLGTLLTISNQKITEVESKMHSLESEVSMLKIKLDEANESKDVTEIQLQEVGDRWRSILNEKEVEYEATRDKLRDLESQQKKEVPTSRGRNLSGDLDFSDPFVCEMEIGRLTEENQKLAEKMDMFSNQNIPGENSNATDNDNESKILALQAQLRSVYAEHQCELALKQQELEREVTAVRDYSPTVHDVDLQDNDLQQRFAELQMQCKREQGFFKQLEQEKMDLEIILQSTKSDFCNLQKENSDLSAGLQELATCRIRIAELEQELTEKEYQEESASTTLERDTRLADLEREIALKETIVNETSSRLSRAEHSLSNKEKEIHQLRVALNTVQSEDFQELRGLADSLKMQVDGYKESLKETGHKLLRAEQHLATASTSEVELKAANSYFEQESLKKTEEIQNLQLDARSKGEYILELQESNTSLKREYSDASSQLLSFKDNLESITRSSNQLKAEKMELVMESKRLREEVGSLEGERSKVVEELEGIKQRPQFNVLNTMLSEKQMTDLQDIMSGNEEQDDDSTPAPIETSKTDVRELKRKLADKSEQLQLLQGKISKLQKEAGSYKKGLEQMQSSHQSEIALIKEEKKQVTEELRNRIENIERDISIQIEISEDLKKANTLLDGEKCSLKREIETQGEYRQDQISSLDLENQLSTFKLAAEKEKMRLMSEIERLMGESAEIEEVYVSVLSEKETLEIEAGKMRESLTTALTEKEVAETKQAKITKNLEKTVARLSVKEAKIDEFSDQLANKEKELLESKELVRFFKSNLTDEIKAAQLGLSEVVSTTEPSVTREPSRDVSALSQSNETTAALGQSKEASWREMASLSQPRPVKSDQEEWSKRVKELEEECGRLNEACRDRDLKIDLLQAEVSSTAETSLSSDDMSKLIDRNSRLQKTGRAAEKEAEGLRAQNLELLHQRDFYQAQAKQQHDSMETLREEANKLISEASEKEKKSASELERLQEHLVRAEQTHTEEYLVAAQNETGLRGEVGQLREQILSANQALDSLRATSSEEITNLTSQLHVISNQRDQALFQVSAIEDQSASYQTSLANLQTVLEQFQQDREGYATEVQDLYKRDLEIMTQKFDSANTTISHLEARVSEIKLIEEDFKTCRDDSRSKDDRIKTLQREVSKLDVALKVAQEGLQKVRSTSEDKVERSLMKTFFTQYLTAPDARKPEVLRLMTSILNYSESELEALKKGKDSSWLGGLLAQGGQNPNPTSSSPELIPGQSFSELFVSFLETEANRGSIMGTPRPSHQRSASVTSSHVTSSHVTSSHVTSSHVRTLSNASSLSSKSAPVTTTMVVDQSPTSLQQTDISHSPVLANSPVLIPSSLSDLLTIKTEMRPRV